MIWKTEKRPELIAKIRFTPLLAALFFFLAIIPLIAALPGMQFLISAAFFLMLVLAAYSTMDDRRFFWIVVIILLPVVGAEVVLLLLPSAWSAVSHNIASALFFAVVIGLILRRLLKSREVTADTIAGSICVYLLLGLAWANLYSLVEILYPGSFYSSHEFLSKTSTGRLSSELSFIYFSFVTLTTLGFGDITPATLGTKTLTWMEALVGQLYIAVTIAGFVGKSLSRTAKVRGKDSPRETPIEAQSHEDD